MNRFCHNQYVDTAFSLYDGNQNENQLIRALHVPKYVSLLNKQRHCASVTHSGSYIQKVDPDLVATLHYLWPYTDMKPAYQRL